MKNKLNFIILFFSIFLCFTNGSFSEEIFNFDVTEAEIKNNGNRFFGKKVE